MRRHLGLILICLLAGAVINVLVAWAIVLYSNPKPAPAPPLMSAIRVPAPSVDPLASTGTFKRENWKTPPTTVTIHPHQLQISQVYRAETLGDWVVMRSYFGPPDTLRNEEFRSLLPRWSRFRDGEPTLEWVVQTHPRRAIITYVETTAGWPLQSVRGSALTFERDSPVDTKPLHPDSFEGLIRLADRLGLDAKRRDLPWLPVFPEFLINTSFYAACMLIPWLVFRGVKRLRATRRMRKRLRRGLCTSCNYDLRGAPHAVCPECGAPTSDSTRGQRQSHTPQGRRTLNLFTLVALGGITNLITLVVLSCVVPPAEVSPYQHPKSEVFYGPEDSSTAVVLHRRFGVDTIYPFRTPVIRARNARTTDDLPAWIDLDALTVTDEVVARGWPLRTAHARLNYVRGPIYPKPHVQGGIRTPLPDWTYLMGLSTPRVVPYLPIWRGIIVNTLFYAAAWWMMWIMLSAIGNKWRCCRGLRSSRRGDLCGADHEGGPECGATVAVPSYRQSQSESQRPVLVKRHIALILICLFAGVVINVLVAWACALLMHPELRTSRWWGYDVAPLGWIFEDEGKSLITIEHEDHWGRSSITVFQGTLAYWTGEDGPTLPMGGETSRDHRRRAISQMPRWSRSAMNEHRPVVVDRMFIGTGFPCHSMRAELVQANGLWILKDGGFDATRIPIGSLTATTDPPRVLPLRPIWTGTVINTLSYGLIIYGVVQAWLIVRGAIRRRRWQCHACGYDIRGANHEVCPECGACIRRLGSFTHPPRADGKAFDGLYAQLILAGTRRIGLIFAASLPIGAALSVVAAWAMLHISSGTYTVTRIARSEAGHLEAHYTGGRPETYRAFEYARPNVQVENLRLWDWDDSTITWIERGRSGWPYVGSSYVQVWADLSPRTYVYQPRDRPIGDDRRMLFDSIPLRPVWPEFALNTVFHGVFVTLVVVAVILIRNARHQQQHAACGA